MMKELSKKMKYKCVNCGDPAAALFKTYGPSVLKLTKCDNCKGIVDKYIEYDPVIVVIDLVLMSKEAQRHVLYNTEFKSYWKLLIILILLETYGVWRSDSMFNIVVNTVCGIHNNMTDNYTVLSIPISVSILETWQHHSNCIAWAHEGKGDDTDLFIWEKDFYIKFIAIFAGIMAFIVTVQISMQILHPSLNKVSLSCLVRALSVGNAGAALTLPMLVWGAGSDAPRYLLAFLYTNLMFLHIFTVVYECPVTSSILVLSLSNIAKFATSFYVTPYLRMFIT